MATPALLVFREIRSLLVLCLTCYRALIIFSYALFLTVFGCAVVGERGEVTLEVPFLDGVVINGAYPSPWPRPSSGGSFCVLSILLSLVIVAISSSV